MALALMIVCMVKRAMERSTEDGLRKVVSDSVLRRVDAENTELRLQ